MVAISPYCRDRGTATLYSKPELEERGLTKKKESRANHVLMGINGLKPAALGGSLKEIAAIKKKNSCQTQRASINSRREGK